MADIAVRNVAHAVLVAAIAAAGCCAWPTHFAQSRVQPLLIYYGSASGSSALTEAAKLARSFRGYPIVIFGVAWRRPVLAEALRADSPHTRFYGYANVGQVSMGHVLRRLKVLASMHFDGVLLDEVGTSLSASTKRLQRIVDAAHRDRLAVLLNAWDPHPVLALHLIPAKDAVLCENWVYADGSWHLPRTASDYSALRTLQARGVRVVMGVTAGGAPVAPSAIAQAVDRTVYTEVGNDVAVSGPYYSATTNAVFPARSLRRLISAISY